MVLKEGVIATYSNNQNIGSVATLTCDAENGYMTVGTDIGDKRMLCSENQGWITNWNSLNCTCTLIKGISIGLASPTL